MNKIVSVEPLDDYKILLTFSNNEKRIKDMKPYLDKGVFKKLKDKNFFNSVHILKSRVIPSASRIKSCLANISRSSFSLVTWSYPRRWSIE